VLIHAQARHALIFPPWSCSLNWVAGWSLEFSERPPHYLLETERWDIFGHFNSEGRVGEEGTVKNWMSVASEFKCSTVWSGPSALPPAHSRRSVIFGATPNSGPPSFLRLPRNRCGSTCKNLLRLGAPNLPRCSAEEGGACADHAENHITTNDVARGSCGVLQPILLSQKLSLQDCEIKLGQKPAPHSTLTYTNGIDWSSWWNQIFSRTGTWAALLPVLLFLNADLWAWLVGVCTLSGGEVYFFSICLNLELEILINSSFCSHESG